MNLVLLPKDHSQSPYYDLITIVAKIRLNSFSFRRHEAESSVLLAGQSRTSKTRFTIDSESMRFRRNSEAVRSATESSLRRLFQLTRGEPLSVPAAKFVRAHIRHHKMLDG